jgi:DNA-binding NtrC family response regulator
MKPNIMFVDDSISVLECLQWTFKDEPYYIFTLDNPFDALSVINTLEWAVVIVERHMKNMDGLEFLKKVRARSPHTMGIIMTGYTESIGAFDKLYPDCVCEFVKKPLDIIAIKQAVKSAITQYELNVENKRETVS